MVGLPDARDAQALLAAQGLRFETPIDDLVTLYDAGRAVACGARSGYVLKMIAIDPDYQGTGTLGDLVTQLIASAQRAGHDTVFVFTRPTAVPSFQALGFRLLTVRGSVALLEHGPGLSAYLAALPTVETSANGAIVMNGNPVTRGHVHLIEHAAAHAETVYVFVVREDQSVFPFAHRFQLFRECTAHLPNVQVVHTSRYAVSAGTFPSYFLKRLDEAARWQMEVDVSLFAEQLAPPLRIVRRFVGDEPLCETTSAYNAVLRRVLDEHRLVLEVIPRLEADGHPISATRVRTALAAGDAATLDRLLPAPTIRYLHAPDARDVLARLRQQDS